MKIRITEENLSHIQEMERLKKMVFKYWDKNGVTNRNLMKKLMGPFAEKVGNWVYNSWVIEFLGKDKVHKMLDEFFLTKEFKIDNCGGYEFDFKVTKYKLQEDGEVMLSLIVDDINGTVVLVMLDGMIYNLKKAREDKDFGWEIDEEIMDCIYDFFDKNILDKFGLNPLIESLNYTSGQEVFDNL